MGLINAAIQSVKGVMADQWKEFFYCDSLGADVLMVKGQKKIGNKSSNKNGNDNIISNGSGIVVNEGQCMMIVEQGKVVEFCAEPGEFTYDTSSEPSIFTGKFGKSLLETFKTVGKRFTYGGDTGKDQRIYYFNTKELLDNKFGTANPIPFRVVDSKIGLDADVSLRCAGVYSYRIADPLLFYSKVCGNVTLQYKRSELDNTLKSEFISKLQPAFAQLSDMEIRPNQVIAHNGDLEAAMKQQLSVLWGELRGLEIVNVALSTVTLPDEDAAMIKEAQRKAMYRDPGMAGANLVDAQAEAMKAAANNTAGAMTGFLGMGMAMNAGGGSANISNLYGMAAQQQNTAPAANGWTCPKCGKVNTGKFCSDCGTAKPEAAAGWTCPKCGKENTGKFCSECGTAKPEEAASWFCPNCGKENTGKFCSDCGTQKP